MSKVAIIGVGQSKFVRSYPGSIRELVFEGFKDAMQDAQLTTKDIDASVVCSAPEYDKHSRLFMSKPCAHRAVPD
jgi:acetyl-CoA C-acetyltransferase